MANKGVAANGLWENEGHSDDNQTDMYIATFREIGTLSNRLIAAAAVVRDWRPGQEPFSKYRSEIDGILDQIDELEARVYSKSAPRLRRKKVRDSDDGQFDARDDDYSYELSDLRATIAQAFDTATDEARAMVERMASRVPPDDTQRVSALGYAIINQVQDDLRGVLARIDVSAGKSAGAHLVYA